MRQLDESHEAARALEQLLPEAIVVGGSFAGWLPDPWAVASADREALMASARETAMALCVRELLTRVGLDADTRVETREGGDRDWPEGHVGSLTYKGSVVLGAIAPARLVKMIGIDLERADRGNLADIEGEIAGEGVVPGIDPSLARLLAFSAKEAVFKAQYPLNRLGLGFSDVRLMWERTDGENIRAAVHCCIDGLLVRARIVGRWVVVVAISHVKTIV